MMYNYWPRMLDNPEASEHERNHAAWVYAVEKLVYSKSLSEGTWNNASLTVFEGIGIKVNAVRGGATKFFPVNLLFYHSRCLCLGFLSYNFYRSVFIFMV
ncbi:hypothetical protein [Streptococcus suis]|uniref:hypothetical protein n=1 Tax=Streptococcus suis TaxID=1307 RepID=UPI00344FD391